MKTESTMTTRWCAEGPADLEGAAQAVRGLLALLLVQGFAPAARARVGTAVAEVLENVVRHAYPDPFRDEGTFRLEARVEGPRLWVEISDEGVGFDATRFGERSKLDPARSGLARARALAEGLGVASRPDRGSTVMLEFTASSAVFGDERGIDLSENDFLEPALARRLLEQVREGPDGRGFQLSPALAVCVGRLLSAPRAASTLLANTGQ